MVFIALAIFTRSAAAYEALKSFDVLQLPSRSLLQSYTGTFLVPVAIPYLTRLLSMSCSKLSVRSKVNISPSQMVYWCLMRSKWHAN